MVEFGNVKFFAGRDGKKFGFIRMVDDYGDETGEEIFFHYNNNQNIVDWEGSTPIFTGKSGHPRYPRKGDLLVFELRIGNKGRHASPWSFAGKKRPPLARVAQSLRDSSREEHDEDDELVSMATVRSRANARFGYGSEQAREAAEMYPGDVI